MNYVKCDHCPATYSTEVELIRHMGEMWNHYPNRYAALLEENAKLRAALKPFAVEAESLKGDQRGHVIHGGLDMDVWETARTLLTKGT